MYQAQKDTIIVKANDKHGNLVGVHETSLIEEKGIGSTKRIIYNKIYSEIVILHYSSDKNQKGLVAFDTKIYLEHLSSIIKKYIVASGDYYIVPPAEIIAPLVFEVVEKKFDGKLELQKIGLEMVNLKEPYSISQFDTDKFFLNNISEISTEERITDSNIRLSSSLEIFDDSIMVETLTKAKREVKVNKNYKYALLECFTYAEFIVSKFITIKKLEKGISNKKIKNYERDITMSYKLNIEIFLIFDLNEDDRKVICDVDQIRDKRNNIIHGNKEGVSVSKADAVKAINAVTQLYHLLKAKMTNSKEIKSNPPPSLASRE